MRVSLIEVSRICGQIAVRGIALTTIEGLSRGDAVDPRRRDVTPPVHISEPKWRMAQAADRLESFGKPELDGFPVRRLVCEGEPEAQIMATAQAEESQLLIVLTHGYGKIRRFLMGSTTAKVLHDAGCPVLTGVHFKMARQPQIKHVACAIDLGPMSCGVLTWAARVARDFDACLSIVHAVARLAPSLQVVSSSDLKYEMEALIRAEVETLEAAAGLTHIAVCIEEGDVARCVCSYAASVGADLLVIGRGDKPGGSERLRSNAYAIVRESSCPVLSV
jgi:nucleotide-binding universal stress UspA family protein